MDETTPGQWATPSAAAPDAPAPDAPAPTPSPFAPPRPTPPAAVPMAPPPSDVHPNTPLPGLDAPTTSVVVEQPPKKSRKGLVAAVAVVAVAALGAGTFFLLRGDDGTAFALDQAAANAADAHGAKSHITTTAMGQKIEMDGEVNNDTGVVHLNMNLGGSLGVDASIEAIVDSKQAVMYLGSAFLSQLGTSVDTKWVKIDKQALEDAGQDTSFFDQIDLGSTVNPAELFDKAKSVKDVGFDEVDGEKVKHYEVTLAAADVAKMDKLLQQQLDQLGGDLPDEIVYDMYVTEDNEIRRIAYELDLGVTKVKVDTVQHLLDEPPTIELPDPKDVTDVADLI